MVIFRMGLEVLGKIFNALTQQRNLHFRGAGIALMKSELLYYPFFLLLSNPHDLRFVSLSFFTVEVFSTATLECKVTDDALNALPYSIGWTIVRGSRKSFHWYSLCYTAAPMISFTISGALFVLLLATVAELPGAEFYRWVDGNGVIHFTDNLQTIPNSRRGTITRMQGQEKSRPETAKPAAPDLTKTSVPFERHGHVVVVEALLNKKTAAKLVVDTGATFTMISAATARELNLDYSQAPRTMPFQTANGIIQAPLTDLESITVGGIEIKNLTTAIHDAVPSANVAGLLGLNFLSNFRMDIDTTKGLLHLEKK